MLPTLQAMLPSLLLLLAWMARPRDCNNDRRLSQFALLLVLVLCLHRIFPFDGGATWGAISVLGNHLSFDGFSALFVGLMSWLALGALQLNHSRPTPLIGSLFFAAVAFASLNFAFTMVAVVAFSYCLGNSLQSEERPPPPRLSLAVTAVAALALMAMAGGWSYLQLGIGMSQAWLDQGGGFMVFLWAVFSFGLMSVGRWAIQHGASLNASTSQRLFAIGAAPLALFAVWLRFSTALFAGVVQGNVLEVDQGLMGQVQGWLLLAIILLVLRSFRADRHAEDWMGHLAAAVPVQLGLWLLAAISLDQEAVYLAIFAMVVFSVAAVGLARPAPDCARIWRLCWGLLIAAWIGLPLTAGFHQRWLLGQDMLANGQFTLAAIAFFLSLLLLIRLLPTALDPRNHAEKAPSRLFPALAAAVLLAAFVRLDYLNGLAKAAQNAIFW